MTVVLVPITGAVVTGDYISQSDVEDEFGVDNVARWSQLDNDVSTADTTRIQKAVDYAEDYVNGKFRNKSRYTVPFNTTTTPTEVVRWCAVIAGIWLYRSRGTNDTTEEGDRMDERMEEAKKDMDGYLSGAREMDAAKTNNESPTGPSIVVVGDVN